MKGLDWTNERWVRLHTRDTSVWNMLSWEAQCVWLSMLRLTDHAGIFSVKEGTEPWRSVASMIPSAPHEAIEKGVNELLSEKWLLFDPEHSWLYDPEKTERDVPMSDKIRQRESRDRRKALAEASIVTNRDKVVTDSDQSVTPGHAVSLQPSLAYPSLAKPSQDKRADHKEERKRLLTELEVSVPGFREAWNGWIGSVKKSLWAQVLTLRQIQKDSQVHSKELILEMVNESAKNGWKSAKPSYIKVNSRRDTRAIVPETSTERQEALRRVGRTVVNEGRPS